MVIFTATVTVIALLAAASSSAQTLVVSRSGSRPVRPAPAQNFAGSAQIEMLFEAVDPSHASGGTVTLEPGARTAWHAHQPQSPSAPQAPAPNAQPAPNRPSGPLQQRLAPGLAALTDDVLYGDVWRRPELSPRDRSLVTVSVLIATGKLAQLAGHLGRAFDNGVQPSEASGLLAHLAIYCGWPSAVSALEVYDQVYTARKVDTAALSALRPRLPVPASDAARARAVNDELGTVAPKFVQLTNDVVFDDLWRRSDLTLRDRSLVTIAALAAMGDDGQLEVYLRLGIESGLTRAQITEAMTHLGFYGGWGRATKAMTAVVRTLGK